VAEDVRWLKMLALCEHERAESDILEVAAQKMDRAREVVRPYATGGYERGSRETQSGATKVADTLHTE
jgi:hypothetical protein